MNIFRLVADVSHMMAILLLLLKINKTHSVGGISFKSQLLFLIVYVTRYLDLFWSFVSVYNTLAKIFFISATAYTVYLIRFRYVETYDKDKDLFRIEYLLVPCAILALVFNYDFDIIEILWSFSIFTESVAIMPQLYMLQTTGQAETITAHYLSALGVYRGMYILNWVYRYFFEDYVDIIAWIAGLVQTVLYADFFYIYITRVIMLGKRFELPI